MWVTSKSLSPITFLCLVTLFAAPTRAVECYWWNSIVASLKCDPIFESLSKTSPRSREGYAVYAQQCDKAVTCLTENPCHNRNRGKADLEDFCGYVRLTDFDHNPCLKGFFRNAYLSQFSDDESCFKNFTSLTESMSLNQEEFINGKSCFLSYVEDNCNAAARNYFSKHFDNFIKFIPSTRGCTDPQVAVAEAFCNGLNDEYRDRLQSLNETIIRSNSLYLSNTIKLCKDISICLKGKCADFIRKRINKDSSTCHLLENYFL
ncbi:unnamed protein product [Caenorhabditis brenneri]